MPYEKISWWQIFPFSKVKCVSQRHSNEDQRAQKPSMCFWHRVDKFVSSKIKRWMNRRLLVGAILVYFLMKIWEENTPGWPRDKTFDVETFSLKIMSLKPKENGRKLWISDGEIQPSGLTYQFKAYLHNNNTAQHARIRAKSRRRIEKRKEYTILFL